MATQLHPSPPIGEPPPELHSGDRLTQREFHAIYERLPEHFRAELVGGIVYVASPMKLQHGTNHLRLGSLFLAYADATPGTEVADNATAILNDDNEPQPDLMLRILPECGGQSATTSDDYVSGPPELIAEVSASTLSLDLGARRREYAAVGVKEYLVLNLRDRRLHWYDLAADVELSPDADGVYRVRCFPGLWIDAKALIEKDIRKLNAVLDTGLATPEHAAFVAKLAAAKTP